MRVRHGFVSNSSSSSFVVVARRIPEEELKSLSFFSVPEAVYVLGNRKLGEGVDFFCLKDAKMFERAKALLQKKPSIFARFYQVWSIRGYDSIKKNSEANDIIYPVETGRGFQSIGPAWFFKQDFERMTMDDDEILIVDQDWNHVKEDYDLAAHYDEESIEYQERLKEEEEDGPEGIDGAERADGDEEL